MCAPSGACTARPTRDLAPPVDRAVVGLVCARFRPRSRDVRRIEVAVQFHPSRKSIVSLGCLAVASIAALASVTSAACVAQGPAAADAAAGAGDGGPSLAPLATPGGAQQVGIAPQAAPTSAVSFNGN